MSDKKFNLKQRLNLQWLTQPEINENKKNLILRIFFGVLLILIVSFSILRAPYFGEVIDGLIFDLLLFGTAKYFFYVLMLIFGVFLLIYNKRYWRIFIMKKFVFLIFILLAFFSLIFQIIYYYQFLNNNLNEINNNLFKLYFDTFFLTWKKSLWINITWMWDTSFFINGGLWWTIIVGLNVGIPIFSIFVILFIILILIVLYCCILIRVKKFDKLYKKIIDLFDEYNKTNLSSNKIDHMLDNSALKDQSINTMKIFTELKNINNEKIYEHIALITKPFSIKCESNRDLKYYDEIVGQSIDNHKFNELFAKNISIKLLNYFSSKNINGQIKKYHSGPRVISILYELVNAKDCDILSKFKQDLSSIFEDKNFCVYLKTDNLLEFQFTVPKKNKINFADVNKIIDPLNKNLQCVIGWNDDCQPWILPIENYKSLLIAGSVGSGKGMLISSIILSLIVNYSSAELMLAIVDTRIGYLSRFQGIPHLVSEIPNTVNDALELFGKISYELKYRVNLIKNAKVSSIQEYNKLPNITSPIKPFIIVINDFNDLLNENSEYVLKFLKTLNNYSNLLNCRLIAITDNIHPLYIENDFNLIFGFKINSLFADNSIINKNYLNKLHGDGDFILFDSIQPISILTRGLACYVDSNDLMHIVNELKNLYS